MCLFNVPRASADAILLLAYGETEETEQHSMILPTNYMYKITQPPLHLHGDPFFSPVTLEEANHGRDTALPGNDRLIRYIATQLGQRNARLNRPNGDSAWGSEGNDEAVVGRK